MNLIWDAVVEVRERNAVLSAHRLAYNDLVDVVELVPVFVSAISKATIRITMRYVPYLVAFYVFV